MRGEQGLHVQGHFTSTEIIFHLRIYLHNPLRMDYNISQITRTSLIYIQTRIIFFSAQLNEYSSLNSCLDLFTE
ncbi:hypothetical protein ACJX0J_033877 [Zea mays]